MSAQPEYLVIGDSNVKRFYTKIGMSHVQNLEFVEARNLAEFNTALSSFKNTFKMVILAFLTNLIVDAGDSATNDVDRMSAIEELYNTVIPSLRYNRTMPLFFLLFSVMC